MTKIIMKKVLITMCLLIAVVGCKDEEKKKLVVSVQTEVSEKLPKQLHYEYPAVLTADKNSSISFRVAGPITKMNIEIGDFLKKGDIIAQMDERDYLIEIKAMEKKVEVAKNVYNAEAAIATNEKSQYKRVEKLYNEKSIAKKSYDQSLAAMKASASAELAALSQYESALEGLKASKNQLADTMLTAPFDGYISNKYFHEGSIVAPGTPVVSMSSNNNSKVRINISGKDVEKLSLLSGAKFIVDNKEYNLDLNTVSKVKGIGKIAYPVTFDFSDDSADNLLIDSEGIVELIYDNEMKGSIIIPMSALFGEKDKKMVWVYKDNHVTKKEVTNLLPYDDGTVIVKGLSEDDIVVTKGVQQLFENQEVKVLEGFSKSNTGKLL